MATKQQSNNPEKKEEEQKIIQLLILVASILRLKPIHVHNTICSKCSKGQRICAVNRTVAQTQMYVPSKRQRRSDERTNEKNEKSE